MAALTATRPSRRKLIAAAIAGAAASGLPRPLLAQGAQPRVVVIGGGFAGATAARFLKRTDPQLDVTLVEPNAIFAACPFSNEVIAGLRDMQAPSCSATTALRPTASSSRIRPRPASTARPAP